VRESGVWGVLRLEGAAPQEAGAAVNCPAHLPRVPVQISAAGKQACPHPLSANLVGLLGLCARSNPGSRAWECTALDSPSVSTRSNHGRT